MTAKSLYTHSVFPLLLSDKVLSTAVLQNTSDPLTTCPIAAPYWGPAVMSACSGVGTCSAASNYKCVCPSGYTGECITVAVDHLSRANSQSIKILMRTST